MCIQYLRAYISRTHTVRACIDIPLHTIALENSKCAVSLRNVYMETYHVIQMNRWHILETQMPVDIYTHIPQEYANRCSPRCYVQGGVLTLPHPLFSFFF